MGPSDHDAAVSSESPPAAEEGDQPNNRSINRVPSVLNGAEHQRVSALLGVLLIVAGFGTIGTVDAPVALGVASSAESVGLRLDPNSAPWWELTVIPGVGEITARRIVSFRSENGVAGDRPFRRPADLQAVHGIGPKTAARLTPYLVFPDS